MDKGNIHREKQESRLSEIATQSDQVLLACLQIGHNLALHAQLHRLDASVDPNYLSYKEVDQTLEHWLPRCQRTSQLKQTLF